MRKANSIVILTGAGISAESGLSTFRDNDGLWCNHRVEDVATPEAYARNPKLVQDFYNMRRAQLNEVQPNAAHIALAELADTFDGSVMLVTQNVDNLHERALESLGARDKEARSKGMRNEFELLHMHGELTKARCTETDIIYDWHADIAADSQCACCYETDTLRPHIVWFGEMPLYMEKIERALMECDVFVSIGTSGNVYPAAGFVQQVKRFGHGRTVELNMEPSQVHSLFDEKIYGPATRIVPEFVKRVLG